MERNEDEVINLYEHIRNNAKMKSRMERDDGLRKGIKVKKKS